MQRRSILALVILLITTPFAAADAKPLRYAAIPATQASDDASREVVEVKPISDPLRRDYQLDPFYQKSASVDGIVLVGSEHVSDYAFLECAYTLDHLLNGRPVVLDALHKAKVRVGIIAVTEYTMDIPENRHMGNGAFNDRRSRGLGGLPWATCAEENLLNLHGDPYWAENITIHEFSHTVAFAMKESHPEWYRRLRKAYEQAMAAGKYAKSYAATDEQEYWAEGAQSWFNCACAPNDGGNATRDDIKKYDPALAELLTEVYGDGPWRFFKTTSKMRSPDELAHLEGLDRDAMPTFDFEKSPRIRALKK